MHPSFRLLAFFAAGLLCCAARLSAAEEDKSKVKIEGFVRSLLNVQSDNRGDTWEEGRLNLKSKRKKGLRGELEVEVETKADTLDVLEALVDRKLDDRWRWELGRTQKRMGVEYEEGRTERPTIERTLIYRRLELFNYVGRETLFRLRQEDEAELFNDWSVTAAFSESQNASLIYNWQKALPTLDARYGLWVQLGTDKMQDDVQTVYSFMNSIWHRSADVFWQAEWVLGVDPQQSEFELIFGDKRTVYFSGIDALYGQKIAGDSEEFWTALASSSFFLHDQRKTSYNSAGLMLGLRYTFADLRISANAEVVGSNSAARTDRRTFDESSFKAEAMYVF